MLPLSCANCCHNPLQTGPVGSAVGYCTRHKVTLNAPNHTTCGQLQRRDLQRERAEAERETHARTFSTAFVSDLASRTPSKLVSERTHVVELKDPVVREVVDYGLMPKIGTLAVLRKMSSVRAEIALTSLGRTYFANCMRRDHKWTSGLHLAWWMLNRVADEPDIQLQDLREESSQPLAQRVDLATWYIVAARLLLLLDVSNGARNQPGANGVPRLAGLIVKGFVEVPAGNGRKLLRYLHTRRKKFSDSFPEDHYRRLASELHEDADDARPD